jgi:hypothetical protein
MQAINLDKETLEIGADNSSDSDYRPRRGRLKSNAKKQKTSNNEQDIFMLEGEEIVIPNSQPANRRQT